MYSRSSDAEDRTDWLVREIDRLDRVEESLKYWRDWLVCEAGKSIRVEESLRYSISLGLSRESPIAARKVGSERFSVSA